MKYRDDLHKYFDEDGEYLPATYFIKTFEPYKDWNKIAIDYAKKHGRTVESVQKEWNTNRDNAAAKGTKYHAEKERQMLNYENVCFTEKSYDVHSVCTVDGIKEDTNAKLSNNTIYPEKIIWSKNYKICGTADLVIVEDGVIHIKDYKTNKKLDFEAYDHPRKGKEKMKSPLTHLDCCNFNTYQLQLNLYMFMLLQQNRNLKMGTMTILHVIFEGDTPIDTLEIPVQNLQAEVRGMLEYYKNKCK